MIRAVSEQTEWPLAAIAAAPVSDGDGGVIQYLNIGLSLSHMYDNSLPVMHLQWASYPWLYHKFEFVLFSCRLDAWMELLLLLQCQWWDCSGHPPRPPPAALYVLGTHYDVVELARKDREERTRHPPRTHFPCYDNAAIVRAQQQF